ncbi:Solute carrier family 25 member 44 [Balamuthia mandrillaris]
MAANVANTDIDWASLDKSKFYSFSTVSFFGVRTLVYPPILVKTRLQVQKRQSQYKGTLDAFAKIFRQEGPRGFYKGFLTTTMGILPGQFTYLTVYEYVRAHLPLSAGPGTDFLRNFLGGASASLCSSTVTVPLDVISQLLMIQDGKVNKAEYSGGWDAAKSIYKTQGIRGLYRGYGISILVYVPYSAFWWSSYTEFKKVTMGFVTSYAPILHKVDVLLYGLCGSTAGACAVVLTNPLDVVKTRLQVMSLQNLKEQQTTMTVKARATVFSTARELWKEEGLWAFKRGITARILAVAPVSFLLITCYEVVKRLSLIKPPNNNPPTVEESQRQLS